MKTLTWQKPGQQNVAQELIKIIINYVAELRDKRKLEQTIENAIEEGTVGYVCSVESNNLTVANNNPEFLNVLNGALVNNCDGSVLAKILGYIHHKPLESYIGADIFIKYVRMCRYRQFFLGNTPEVLSGLKDNLSKK